MNRLTLVFILYMACQVQCSTIYGHAPTVQNISDAFLDSLFGDGQSNRNIKISTTVETSTEVPNTILPTTDEPTTEEPTTVISTTEEPTTESQTTKESTTENPTTEEPTTVQQTTETTTPEDTEKTTTETPVVLDLTTEKETVLPTTEATTEVPSTTKTTEKSTTEDSKTDPSTGIPTSKEPNTEEPTTEDSTSESPSTTVDPYVGINLARGRFFHNVLPNGKKFSELGKDYKVYDGVDDWSRIVANDESVYVLHPVQGNGEKIMYDPYTIGQVLGYIYEKAEFGPNKPPGGKYTIELMGPSIPSVKKRSVYQGKVHRARLVFKKKEIN